MRDFRDSKAIAHTLRDALALKSIAISHSESLELVARMFGVHNWNELSARIQSERQAVVQRSGASTRGVGMPFVPMRDFVLFPGKIAPLWLGRPTSRKAVEHAMLGERRIFAVAQRKSDVDEPAVSDLHGVGVIAEVIDVTQLQDQRRTGRIIVKGLERALIERAVEGQDCLLEIAAIGETGEAADDAQPICDAVLSQVQTLLGLDPSSPFCARISDIREPGLLADAVAPLLQLSVERAQSILEERNPVDRLKKIQCVMSGNA